MRPCDARRKDLTPEQYRELVKKRDENRSERNRRARERRK